MSCFNNPDKHGLLGGRQLRRIHSAGLEFLRETGMALGAPEARSLFKDHGLKVSRETVFLPNG